MEILDRIKKLKIEKDALILAHYYEEGVIQDLADQVGDSLYLAQQGESAPNPVILLAGVVFMAESVKLLSPNKTVLVPDLNAGCSLVDHSPIEKYQVWRDQNPNAIMVTYINSSAEVKALSDIICTSSNAEAIINSIPKDRDILFGPDGNLGSYLEKKTGRKMDLWPGACEVHVLFSEKKLIELKMDHPNAVVLAHPECLEAVLQHADVVGSTSKLISEVTTRPETEFIVATEDGIFHQMKKSRPDALLLQAPAEGSCACNQCPYMKLNNLEKIEMALKNLNPQVSVATDMIPKSRLPLERMLSISKGEKIDWATIRS